METSKDQHTLAEEVNRRYWDTGQSVNQIADELGISKGMLYELLDVMPAGVRCPRCSNELGYANRTAREKGFVTCVACGFEEELEALVSGAAAVGEPAPPDEEAPVAEPKLAVQALPLPRLPVWRDAAALAGAALIGLATGVVLGRWIGKRR